MSVKQKDAVVPPRKSPSQKHDDTTLAALSIIDKEALARERKTQRLRDLRLAREAAEAAEPKPAVKAKPRAKAKAR